KGSDPPKTRGLTPFWPRTPILCCGFAPLSPVLGGEGSSDNPLATTVLPLSLRQTNSCSAAPSILPASPFVRFSEVLYHVPHDKPVTFCYWHKNGETGGKHTRRDG